jgi:hypothetical protein
LFLPIYSTWLIVIVVGILQEKTFRSAARNHVFSRHF